MAIAVDVSGLFDIKILIPCRHILATVIIDIDDNARSPFNADLLQLLGMLPSDLNQCRPLITVLCHCC